MDNKIAIVTGGNRGLGKHGVLNLAAKGIDSIFTYRSHQDEADAVVNEVKKLGRKALALQLDVGKTETFPSFVEAVGGALSKTWGRSKFDFLVNNAGIGNYTPFVEVTEAQFDELMNVQFKGVFFLTQKLLPKIEDGGRILNISSGLTRMTQPGSGTYAAMKGAIEVWTRYLALELGPRKIGVNVLAPGAIATDFGGGRVRDNPDINKHVAAATALGRVGTPEDIGPLIAFMCTPEAHWINAQRIEASGGMKL